VTDADYSEAILRGLQTEPPRAPRDEICELLEAELSMAAEQWRERIGWRSRFKLEAVSSKTWYHVDVERIYSWWQPNRRITNNKYLGLICHNADGSWDASVDCSISKYATLSAALERFFASPSVAKSLTELFGKVRPQDGPRWFSARDGYQSKVGWFFTGLWWYVVWLKQEICWRVLGRCHVRKR
jgi:hypothetical protein